MIDFDLRYSIHFDNLKKNKFVKIQHNFHLNIFIAKS